MQKLENAARNGIDLEAEMQAQMRQNDPEDDIKVERFKAQFLSKQIQKSLEEELKALQKTHRNDVFRLKKSQSLDLEPYIDTLNLVLEAEAPSHVIEEKLFNLNDRQSLHARQRWNCERDYELQCKFIREQVKQEQQHFIDQSEDRCRIIERRHNILLMASEDDVKNEDESDNTTCKASKNSLLKVEGDVKHVDQDTVIKINNQCKTAHCFTQDALIQENGYCWSCNKAKQIGEYAYEQRMLELKAEYEKGTTVKEQSLEEYILGRNF